MTEFRGVDDRKSENDRKDEGDRKSRYERNDRGGSRWSIWSGHVSGRSRIVFLVNRVGWPHGEYGIMVHGGTLSKGMYRSCSLRLRW